MQEVTIGAPPADGVGERLTSGRREGVRLPLLPLGGSLPPGVGGSAEVLTLIPRVLGRTPCLPPTSIIEREDRTSRVLEL